MSEKKNFIILAHPRSGSSALVDLLNKNGVPVLAEPFNKVFNSVHYRALATKQPDEIVEEIFKDYRGVKTLMTQLGRGNNTFLAIKHPTVILTRGNLLEAAISARLAVATKSWKGESELGKPIHLDKDKVIAMLNFLAAEVRHFTSRCPEALHVSYERLYAEDEETRLSTAKEIFDFLGDQIVDVDAVRRALSPSGRQNKRPWSETVLNWEDFRKTFERFESSKQGRQS